MVHRYYALGPTVLKIHRVLRLLLFSYENPWTFSDISSYGVEPT